MVATVVWRAPVLISYRQYHDHHALLLTSHGAVATPSKEELLLYLIIQTYTKLDTIYNDVLLPQRATVQQQQCVLHSTTQYFTATTTKTKPLIASYFLSNT